METASRLNGIGEYYFSQKLREIEWGAWESLEDIRKWLKGSSIRGWKTFQKKWSN